MNSGHYYTIGRSTRDALCSRDVWYLFNDSQVKRSRDIESLKEWQTPYILFYVRSDLAYRQVRVCGGSLALGPAPAMECCVVA